MRKNVQLIFMILILLFVGFVFIACSSGDERKGNHIENEQATENEADDNGNNEKNQDQALNEDEGSEEENEKNESAAAGDVYSEIEIFSDNSVAVVVNKHNGMADY